MSLSLPLYRETPVVVGCMSHVLCVDVVILTQMTGQCKKPVLSVRQT